MDFEVVQGLDDEQFTREVLDLCDLPPMRFRLLEMPEWTGDAISVVALHYRRLGMGGSERVICALLQQFGDMGFRTILYTDLPPEPGDYDLPTGVERIVVPKETADRPGFWRSEIINKSIDLVICNSWLWRQTPSDILSIRLAGALALYYAHGTSTYYMSTTWQREAMDSSVKSALAANGIVALSEADALYWGGLNRNVFVLPNPARYYLDEEKYVSEPPKANRIVYCGRLDIFEKRLDEMVDAFSLVVTQIPDAELLIIGGDSDDCLDLLRRKAEVLGIADRVTFAGTVSYPMDLLRESNVMVMASPTEGFCLSLAEACAVGLPTVMYEIPSLSLVHGNAGVVQVFQGDIVALADGLVSVLSDRDRQRAMRQSVRAHYQKVCQVDLVALWRAVFDGITAVPQPTFSLVPSAETAASAFLTNMLNAYERELANEERKENNYRQQIQELQDRLRAVEESKSYKIGVSLTEPMRKAKGVFRRG